MVIQGFLILVVVADGRSTCGPDSAKCTELNWIQHSWQERGSIDHELTAVRLTGTTNPNHSSR